ncbi:MAG: hypothetical protein WBM43_09285 [Flavobacteriaceae bacterium]
MKAMKFIWVLVSILFISTISFSQDDKSQKRDETEKNTSPFSINHFSKDSNSYYVLKARVSAGKIVIDEEATIKEVGGKLPYPSGNFRVEILDLEGKALADFNMQDPLLVRSCDEGGNHITNIDTGTVYIPMPKSSDIANIRFSRDRETIQEIEVTEVLKRSFEKNPDEKEDEDPE